MKTPYVLTLALAGFVASERLWVYPIDPSNHKDVINLNVFSNGKATYLGDYTKLNDTEFAPVTYTLSESLPSKLTVKPDTSATGVSPTWSTRIVGIPKSGHDIVLLDPDTDNTSDYIVDFWTYQTNIFPYNGNTFVSYEFAVPSEIEDVYTLEYWPSRNPDGAGAAQVTFRTKKLT